MLLHQDHSQPLRFCDRLEKTIKNNICLQVARLSKTVLIFYFIFGMNTIQEILRVKEDLSSILTALGHEKKIPMKHKFCI